MMKRRCVADFVPAKQTPFSNTSTLTLTTSFGAIDFLPTLTAFLRTHLPLCRITPGQYDRVFKQLILTLPSNPYLGNTPRIIRIRTTPAVKAQGRTPAKSAQFDTVLLVENTDKYNKYGGLQGAYHFFR